MSLQCSLLPIYMSAINICHTWKLNFTCFVHWMQTRCYFVSWYLFEIPKQKPLSSHLCISGKSSTTYILLSFISLLCSAFSWCQNSVGRTRNWCPCKSSSNGIFMKSTTFHMFVMLWLVLLLMHCSTTTYMAISI